MGSIDSERLNQALDVINVYANEHDRLIGENYHLLAENNALVAELHEAHNEPGQRVAYALIGIAGLIVGIAAIPIIDALVERVTR